MFQNERNYDFRKRMLEVHKKNIRNFDLYPENDEFEIKNGLKIIIEETDNQVILTAAKDFVDYLFVSMHICATVMTSDMAVNPPDDHFIRLSVDKDIGEASGYMGYSIDVTEKGIMLNGFDERGIAQGLYYLEDVTSLRMAPFVKKELIRRKALFSSRTALSGYGMEMYPNEHLSAMAHAGIDRISVYMNGVDSTLAGYRDFNELCYRASKYGIDVHVLSYLKSAKHPDDEDAQAFYDSIYGTFFEKCPNVKAITLVGEACEFPSKDPNVGKSPHTENYIDGIPTGKVSPGWWPCEDYPQWIEMIKKSIHRINKNVEIILCSYNWGYVDEQFRIKLIQSLPTDITLMATWEMFEPYKLENSTLMTSDYTLSSVGPGQYFISEAIAAKEREIKFTTISNSAGRTWDFGVIPYEPMPYQWIKRYQKMIEAHYEWNLAGLDECIHYGFWPSFISELEKWAFFAPAVSLEDVLYKMLIRDYGKDNADSVNRALELWSEAITYYTPTNADQYGAFRIGPSYPFWIDADIKPKTVEHAMFGNSIYFGRYDVRYDVRVGDHQNAVTISSISIHDEVASLAKMLKLLEDGLNILEKLPKPNRELLYLINLGKFIYRSTLTGIHAKEHYIIWSKIRVETDRKKLSDLFDSAENLFYNERENAKETIPLVEADSRLGWESSMEYTTDREHLEWKIRQINYELDYTLPAYRRGII